MRWKTVEEKQGAIRERSGFLLFPKTIEGETRWLERAVWIERYGAPYHLFWSAMAWKNE